MARNRKPLWAQIVALALMLLWACGLGLTYAADRQPPVSAVGMWSSVFAGPFVLVAALVRCRWGALSRLWIMSVGVVTYGIAGLFARGYTLDASIANVPIFKLMLLVYPCAGLLWGFVIFRAAEQGYLPVANTS